MRRTQIQLDEDTYAAVRQRAFHARQSISAVVREILTAALKVDRAPVPRRIADFGFIGVARSRPRPGRPISERHDDALVEALAAPRTRRR